MDRVTRLTLVTLDCRPFDIATSVGLVNAAVYSPAVPPEGPKLRLTMT